MAYRRRSLRLSGVPAAITVGTTINALGGPAWWLLLIAFFASSFVGHYTRLDIRFRRQFCYVDAYTEPEPLGPNWPPPDWPESREEYLERLRNTPTHLFRLRYFGDEER